MASGTDALQFINRFADVVERDVVRDVRGADAWRNNKPNVSALDFFVVRKGSENLFARKIRRQLGR